MPACESARAAVGLPELDHQASDLELAADSLSDGVERLVDFVATQQPYDVVQHDGLALALLGFSRALALARGKLAGDGRGQEEEQQRNPLLRIGDGQLVDGCDEEPVEHQKCQH